MLDSQSKKKLVEKTRAARMQKKKKQFAQDISVRKPSDEAERQHSELLDSIRYAQSLFINQDDSRSAFEALLNTLISITDSEYGFIDEVCSNESGKLFKRNLSISNIAWDEESSKLYEKLTKPDLLFLNLNNLSGLPAKTGKLVISNDSVKDERSGGTPKGHPTLKSFMGIPMYFGGELVGVVGVANRNGGYSEQSAAEIETLVSTCAGIIAATRNRHREREYRNLFETMAQGVVYQNAEGHITSANPAAERILGLPLDQMKGRTSCDPHWKAIRKDGSEFPGREHPSMVALRTGKHQKNVLMGVFNSQDGDYHWINVNSVPQFKAGESIPYQVFTTFDDMTEAKRKDEELSRANDYLERILNGMYEGLMVTDRQLRITDVNNSLLERTKTSREQFIGRTCHFVNHRLDQPCSDHKVKCPASAVMKTGRPVRTEHIHLDSDGNEHIVNIYAFPLFAENGEVEYVVHLSADITAQRKAELALKESEERLKILFECAPDAIYLNDMDGNFVDGNMAAEKLTGYQREELIGKSFVQSGLLSNSDVEKATKRLKKTAAFEPAGPEEFTLRRKDGSEITAEISTYPVTIRGQTYALGVAHDITERKKAEQALIESERRFRSLSESAFEGIVFSENGILVDANKAFAEMYRCSIEELIGKQVVELVAPERRELVAEKIRSGFEGVYESKGLRKDGSLIDIEIHGRTIIHQGRKMRMTAVSNITERKQAFEALRVSEEKHRSMIELSPDAIVVINKLGFIELCNSASEKISGFRAEDLTGKHFTKLNVFKVKDIPKYVKLFAQILHGNIPKPFEVDFIRKNGVEATVEVRVSRLRDGKIQAIATEITERKRSRQQLLDYSKQLKSLASRLSLTEERERHRLATILHDQIGQSLVFSKFKLDQIRKSASSEDVTHALEDICDNLGNVIHETRTLTFDLSFPILYELGFEAAVAEWLRDEIEQKHGIETDFKNDNQPKPLDDDIRTVLFRNVRELLVNVVKHANARKVLVSVIRDDGKIHVSVGDDGIGFDPVEVKSRAAKGAEFGLFSIRERLEQLGGTLDISSETGKGTRISMTAPLKLP